MDGWFNEDQTRPSSSSGSLSMNLFHEHCQLFYPIHNGGVPGLAFKDNLPYLELQHSDLLHLASNEVQRQFYQEAGIKTAIFNGCKSGEIEIGMSASTDNLNMQMEMRKWFPEDFSQQFQSRESQMPDQSRPSSSSSSLRSLSMESPEVLGQMNMASTSNYTNPEKPILPLPSHLQTMKAYDEAAIARAMLAVISSPTSSSSSYLSLQSQENQQPQQQVHQRGAFKRYSLSLLPKMETTPKSRGQNTMMRAIAFLKTIRAQAAAAAAAQPEARPTTNQLHHMMSERKRREKLNESFQALRSLLPPGSKKDKASVLTKTREHLSSLKAQVSELQDKNRLLEMRLAAAARSSTSSAAGTDQEAGLGNERAVVRVTETAAASSSSEREIEVRVMVKEEECDLVDLVVRLLECLNHIRINVLTSIEASTQFQQQPNSFHRVILRLNIQAGEWDEQTLREALTRAAADVAR